MTTTDIHPTEARLRAAIIAEPANETLRFALADHLEEQGRHEQADRVRETSRIRPDSRYGGWCVWRKSEVRSKDDDIFDPSEVDDWLFFAVKGDERLMYSVWWDFPDSEAKGMAAILDAILVQIYVAEVAGLLTALDAARQERSKLIEAASDLNAEISRLNAERDRLQGEVRRMANGCPLCGGTGHGVVCIDGVPLETTSQPCRYCGPARRLLANHEGRTDA